MHRFKRNDVIILLGAGASVEAGIPHSAAMIERVEDLINSDDQRWSVFSTLYYYVRSAVHYSDGIKNRVQAYNIERLVATLDELAKRDDHMLYPFVGAWNPKLMEVAGNNFDLVQRLKYNIVEILRRDWVEIKRYEQADYYENIVDFQQEYEHPLRLFSLNYDLCVEMACRARSKYPERGFENRKWDWRLFEDFGGSPKDIFLYKLHGSNDWRKGQDGELTHEDSTSSIPIADVAIIFGNSYKLQYVDPFLFLAYEFRKWTLEAKLIITIGYGFGDEHINGILRQALDKDPERKLLSISPFCRYHDKTEDEVAKFNKQETQRIESLLQLNRPDTGQVICWNLGAREFMEQHLKIHELAALFGEKEPELFSEATPTEQEAQDEVIVEGSIQIAQADQEQAVAEIASSVAIDSETL